MEILTQKQKEQLSQVPEHKRWNEFKNLEYHQGLWLRFWNKIFKGGKDDTVLDFGCGSCWAWVVANALGYKNVINLDIDEEEVRTSFKRYTDIWNSTVVYWDGKTMPFEDDTFNAIVAKASIMKLVQTGFERQVSELCRITKPGGVWYVAPIDMYKRFIADLDSSGMHKKLQDKNITIHCWTWKPFEKEKAIARTLLRPIKNVLRKNG